LSSQSKECAVIHSLQTMAYDRAMSDSPVRHLNLAGASNFRDLGGYPVRAGRSVRWRRIFRSNHLGDLTEDDIEALRDLGLKSAFDLRGTEERLATLCRLDGITVHSLPIEPAIVVALRARLASGEPLSTAETADLIVKAVLISVEQSFLAAAFDTIRSDYGDLESYFERGLGLGARERAMLEQHYLAD
jgi:protein tyrosine/serine phosphatase